MKYSLGISSFLEENSSLFHSIVLLYFFALITEKVFSYLSLLFFGTLHSDLSATLAGRFFTTEPPGKPWRLFIEHLFCARAIYQWEKQFKIPVFTELPEEEDRAFFIPTEWKSFLSIRRWQKAQWGIIKLRRERGIWRGLRFKQVLIGCSFK